MIEFLVNLVSPIFESMGASAADVLNYANMITGHIYAILAVLVVAIVAILAAIFVCKKGTKLVVAGKIHYEPFGIYPGIKSDLKDIATGDVIAVPNDTTNEARALLLLEAQGLLKLKEGAGLTATKQDIVENPYELDIVELEAAQISRSLESVAFAVMNGNYAIQAGISISDALAIEDAASVGAQTYGNIIAVKTGNENAEWVQKLVKVLHSEEVKKFIADKYAGAVVALD